MNFEQRLIELRSLACRGENEALERGAGIENKTDWNLLVADLKATRERFGPSDEITTSRWYRFEPGHEIKQQFYNSHSTNGEVEVACVTTPADRYRLPASEVIEFARKSGAPFLKQAA